MGNDIERSDDAVGHVSSPPEKDIEELKKEKKGADRGAALLDGERIVVTEEDVMPAQCITSPRADMEHIRVPGSARRSTVTSSPYSFGSTLIRLSTSLS